MPFLDCFLIFINFFIKKISSVMPLPKAKLEQNPPPPPSLSLSFSQYGSL